MKIWCHFLGSLFGSQQTSGFGVKTSTSFGGGGFTGGGGSVASSGFGVTTQQQTQGKLFH